MSIYYIEINLMCIILLMLFRMQLKNMKTSSADQRVLLGLISVTILFCFSDMVAGIVRGAQFLGARTMIEVSNLIYFEAVAIISFLWSVYVDVRLMKPIENYHRYGWTRVIPIVIFTIIAILNPWIHFLFRINEQNLYERANGVYLHWVIVWAYFLIPSLKTLHIYLKESSRLRRKEIAPMIYFTIAPLVGSTIQMLFYGVTSTQVGITISIIMICITCQDTQILTDALTGINNRRGFDYYFANSIQHNEDVNYTLVMIDVDKFKDINDKFGHVVGDLVLQRIAQTLKEACKIISNRLHICRFGGDEFVVLGVNCNEREIHNLKLEIIKQISISNETKILPCSFDVSIGSATSKCMNESDLKELIHKADLSMYKEKKEKQEHGVV